MLSLQDLQFLDLSGNKISVLQRGAFLAPNSLTHLYVFYFIFVENSIYIFLPLIYH